jgi:hypothetical protein
MPNRPILKVKTKAKMTMRQMRSPDRFTNFY